jgi:hypothetical protein
MKTLKTTSIPEVFLEWLVSSRSDFIRDLIAGRPLRYFSAHLPVMATWNDRTPFPVNMTVKGIGLVPRDERLRDYIDLFEATIAEARGMSWEESLPKRVKAMQSLYGDVDNFNPQILGGLEIFEGKAFKNLTEKPYASLLYVGMMRTENGLQYISFQVNGKVEILNKDSIYYRYLLAARKLFEFDKFHLYQPDYPFGYLIRVMEVKDKTPWTRTKKIRS